MVTLMADLDMLRPVERRILTMRDEGLEVQEIATRFRRSPEFVDRVIDLTLIPRQVRPTRPNPTALERRVLDLRANGEDHETIGRRFKKSARFIRQVEGVAHYRHGMNLLTELSEERR
jgi:hypothetical protein